MKKSQYYTISELHCFYAEGILVLKLKPDLDRNQKSKIKKEPTKNRLRSNRVRKLHLHQNTYGSRYPLFEIYIKPFSINKKVFKGINVLFFVSVYCAKATPLVQIKRSESAKIPPAYIYAYWKLINYVHFSLFLFFMVSRGMCIKPLFYNFVHLHTVMSSFWTCHC